MLRSVRVTSRDYYRTRPARRSHGRCVVAVSVAVLLGVDTGLPDRAIKSALHIARTLYKVYQLSVPEHTHARNCLAAYLLPLAMTVIPRVRD